MKLIKSNEKMKSNLNNKSTFDNFVIDEMNNKVAYEFALNVAQDPSKIYNPLFIYGENNGDFRKSCVNGNFYLPHEASK